ncbi:hypothetical protein HJG53_02450 [Sphingomonas sp. ID1715]|uniref:hypothetical protein n=1 Tax=Sphingomonas sp. ID1715 TaxID=1656898 RepID=UPI0014892763|nr:hypothetical protein [Sphingomonas sp. ID1715]NNM75767.1 hypothetical protein [Sphingomonas sp. ID1715]
MRTQLRAVLFFFCLGLAGPTAAAPRLSVPVSSNDQVGVAVSGKSGTGRGVSAMLGMWSDDGALELAGFQQGARLDPATARAAEIVSGKAMHSRGVRLTGSFYRSGDPAGTGWTLSVDARQQQVSDIGAALSGTWRTASDSRLTLGGRFRF